MDQPAAKKPAGAAQNGAPHETNEPGQAPLKSAARAKAGDQWAAMPNISQRTVTKVMRAAQSCGLEHYVITLKTGEVRVSVGVEQDSLGETKPNHFDRLFG